MAKPGDIPERRIAFLEIHEEVISRFRGLANAGAIVQVADTARGLVAREETPDLLGAARQLISWWPDMQPAEEQRQGVLLCILVVELFRRLHEHLAQIVTKAPRHGFPAAADPFSVQIAADPFSVQMDELHILANKAGAKYPMPAQDVFSFFFAAAHTNSGKHWIAPSNMAGSWQKDAFGRPYWQKATKRGNPRAVDGDLGKSTNLVIRPHCLCCGYCLICNEPPCSVDDFQKVLHHVEEEAGRTGWRRIRRHGLNKQYEAPKNGPVELLWICGDCVPKVRQDVHPVFAELPDFDKQKRALAHYSTDPIVPTALLIENIKQRLPLPEHPTSLEQLLLAQEVCELGHRDPSEARNETLAHVLDMLGMRRAQSPFQWLVQLCFWALEQSGPFSADSEIFWQSFGFGRSTCRKPASP